MKALRAPSPVSLALATFVLCLAAHATPADYFLFPPGSAWARLLFTNAPGSRAYGIEPCPGGYIISGEVSATNHIYDTAMLAIVDATGALVRSNFFPGIVDSVYGQMGSGAHSVIVSRGNDGQPDGFVFVGYRHLHFTGTISDPRPDWINPAVWVMKTDLLLQPLWETNVSRGVFEYGPSRARWGTGLVQTPGGFLVVGKDYADYVINPNDLATTEEPGTGGFLMQLDQNGNVLEVKEREQPGLGWLSSGPASIAEAPDGGYLLAVGQTVTKMNSALLPLWTNSLPVRSYAAIERSGGGSALVGRKRRDTTVPTWQDTLLAGVDAAGTLQWTNVFGRNSAGDIGRSLVEATPGLVAIGETDSMGGGGADMWIVKTGADGRRIWETAIGGSHSDAAYAAAIAADGHLMIVGHATVDGTNRWIWLVKLNSNLHVPNAEFTVTPPSPVFRDKVLTFDASGSSNPGGSILTYRWDFGDGTTGTGMTAQHSYPQVDTYEVILETISADGPRAWATQAVEVTGLVIQWQRFLGTSENSASKILKGPDNTFVLAGGTEAHGENGSEHLWATKVDRRGMPLWDRVYDGPRGSEHAEDFVRAPEGGYVLAGHYYAYTNSYYYHDLLMLKISEDGEPVWPVKLFGVTNYLNEWADSIALNADGTYFVAGRNDAGRPTLMKTDAEGNEIWTRSYAMPSSRVPDMMVSTPDGGAVVYARSNGDRDWLMKFDSTGLPLWTNVMGYRQEGFWMDLREDPPGGFVLAGRSYDDILLAFHAADGTRTTGQTWTGPAVYQQGDSAYGADHTPDGGYVLTGNLVFKESTWGPNQNEAFLLKTDSDGEMQWMETLPGTTNYSEKGSLVLALTNGSYIVVGDDGRSATTGVWLFKVAPNRAPVPVMQLATNVLFTGETLVGDASRSSDRDGSVVAWEWSFGDGVTNSGAAVSHPYTNSGTYELRLTVTDNEDAERSVTNTVYVSGIRSTGGGFTVMNTSITNCPACDPENYPRTGIPFLIDWDNSRGFIIRGVPTSGSTKTFRITFPEPVPSGLLLYRVPGWTQVSYTLVDKHTIQVSLWLNASATPTNLQFVLGRAAPIPTVTAFQLSSPSRLSVRFPTTTGYRFVVEKTAALTPAGWAEVTHSRTADGAATSDYLDGTGATETVYVDLSGGTGAFFRIRMQEL